MDTHKHIHQTVIVTVMSCSLQEGLTKNLIASVSFVDQDLNMLLRFYTARNYGLFL